MYVNFFKPAIVLIFILNLRLRRISKFKLNSIKYLNCRNFIDLEISQSQKSSVRKRYIYLGLFVQIIWVINSFNFKDPVSCKNYSLVVRVRLYYESR